MQRKIKLTRWFVYEGGKPPRQEPHRVILRSPLPKIHYYHNKRLQVKEFVVTISPFQCTAHITWLTNRCTDPSTWLTTNLRRMLAAKFFSSSTWWRSRNSLVTKPYGVYTQQLLHERDELGHNMLVKNFCIQLPPLWRPLK